MNQFGTERNAESPYNFLFLQALQKSIKKINHGGVQLSGD